ncbi:DUF2142 domain-containing protein [Cellulomonas fimi]|uniref:DUF2142 domain-containing protein n=1 Tax=Cellulomonas fimi TaxID=1708 RepID=A0A7Y0LZN3_CELFI|nr:DUF2142 domain-containing protein [Cellulomonas fimi]NMR20874.1 DUF2142 domain-containing protein [Cellulomonas fimi]
MTRDTAPAAAAAPTEGTSVDAPARRRPSRSRASRAFWAAWGVLFALAAAWAVANPLMASPDEPAHVAKAASVVRGQLLGDDVDGGAAGNDIEVPYFYEYSQAYPTCYMFRPELPGNCEIPAARDLDETVETITTAGRYNPLYYVLVGAPTLAPAGDGVLYAMRLLSAALSTFLLALGVRAVAELRRPAWAALGAMTAISPMVVYLSSTVNPAALEVAAAFALWCQLLTLLRHPDPSRTAGRMGWIAVSSVLLVNSRGLSLLYCALIVLFALLVARWRTLLDVLQVRRTWPSFAVIVLGCLAAAAWVVGTNSLGSGGTERFPDLTFKQAVWISVNNTSVYLQNMIGQFGWTDTNLPVWLHMVFAGALGVVALVALALGTWRERVLLLGLTAVIILLPVVIHASQARYLGIIWQGRYILPIAVGLPILAGYVLVRRAVAIPRPETVRIVTTVATILAWVLAVAFVFNLHRYVNGAYGSWRRVVEGAWLPPVHVGLVLLVGLLGSAGVGVLVARVARGGADGTFARGDTDGTPAAVDDGARAPAHLAADEGEPSTPDPGGGTGTGTASDGTSTGRGPARGVVSGSGEPEPTPPGPSQPTATSTPR